jgi:predicted nucleotidyltransferase
VAAVVAREANGEPDDGGAALMADAMKRANAFAAELKSVFGDDLVSVVLYGSAARGQYRDGVSDLNVLVLLRGTGAATLRRGSALARRWAGERNPPPMILGEEEWRRSADVFPIEYSDIRDAHRVLLGIDPFAGIEVHAEDLRRQCEREIKGKHIQLREQFMLAAEQPAELGTLLVKSFPTFLVLFRTVLRLSGDAVPRDPEETVRATAARAGFDPAPLLEISRARSGRGELRPAADSPVVTGYLDAVERVARYVDRLAGHSA